MLAASLLLLPLLPLFLALLLALLLLGRTRNEINAGHQRPALIAVNGATLCGHKPARRDQSHLFLLFALLLFLLVPLLLRGPLLLLRGRHDGLGLAHSAALELVRP